MRARPLSVLVMAIVLIGVMAAPADAGFADRQRLHGGPLGADWPVVAMSGNTVHALWTEWGAYGNAIYYARSWDGGRTYERARRISPWSVWMRRPDVAVVGPDVHVVFESDHATPGTIEAYYLRSRNAGTNWERVRRLSAADGIGSRYPSVGAEGDFVTVAWSEIRFYGDPTPAAIVTRFSSDAGYRFGPQHSAFTAFSLQPHVAMLDGVIHMAFTWNNGQVWYQRSGTGGRTWVGLRRISPLTVNATTDVDVEAGNRSVHVVFGSATWKDAQARTVEAVFYKRLDHPGRWAWNRLLLITGSGQAPMVSAGGGEVAVTWLRYRLGDDTAYQKILLRTSGTNGSTWRPTERVAGYASSCFDAHSGVATMGDAVVVWSGARDCDADALSVRNT